MTIEWRIYYGDGSVFDNSMGLPVDAPTRDVQVIAQSDPVTGREIWHRRDFYVWLDDRDRWIGVEHFGLWDYLCLPGYKIVKFGRMTSNENMQEIMRRAMLDDDLPYKSAKAEWE
jgi:hypothetical protein